VSTEGRPLTRDQLEDMTNGALPHVAPDAWKTGIGDLTSPSNTKRRPTSGCFFHQAQLPGSRPVINFHHHCRFSDNLRLCCLVPRVQFDVPCPFLVIENIKRYWR
jgi:hypothetical protein